MKGLPLNSKNRIDSYDHKLEYRTFLKWFSAAVVLCSAFELTMVGVVSSHTAWLTKPTIIEESNGNPPHTIHFLRAILDSCFYFLLCSLSSMLCILTCWIFTFVAIDCFIYFTKLMKIMKWRCKSWKQGNIPELN